MRGTVSRATVVENARRRVARDSAGGTKRWNAKARKGATDGDTRWRRDQIHFCGPERLAVRRAPARPEWSVASDAEGGSGERGVP